MTEVLIHPDEGSAAVSDGGDVLPLDDVFPGATQEEIADHYSGTKWLMGHSAIATMPAPVEAKATTPDKPKLTADQLWKIEQTADKRGCSYDDACRQVTGEPLDHFANS